VTDGRRETDKFPLDLDRMIIEETDPKHRSFLVAFGALVKVLTGLTEKIQEDSVRMADHIAEYKADKESRVALFNRSKGWRDVVMPVLAIVQVLVLGIIGISGWVISTEYNVIHSTLEAEQKLNKDQAEKLQALETAEQIDHHRGTAQ